MNDPNVPTCIDDRRRLRRFAYLLLIALAGGLGAASIWRVEPLLSANDRSRWASVRALAEQGTWQIDDVIRDERWDTIDKVRYEDHFYSSKPPLFPLLVSWVHAAVNRVTGAFDSPGWTIGRETAEMTRAILTLVNLVPWLLALAVIAAMTERYARHDATRLFVVASAAMGTMLSTFLVTLNNHLIAAVCVVFALYPSMRIVIDGRRRWWLFALAGFFAALTCTNELPAALFGVLLFGLLLWKAPRPTLLFFVPAALLPLAAFFAVNYEVTGGIKPFYAYYGTELYEYVYHGVPSYWTNPTGLDANDESPWLYLLHCTVGHHGIFSLTPIFLLSLAGWVGLCFSRLRSRMSEVGGRRSEVGGRRSEDESAIRDRHHSPLTLFNGMGLVLTLAVIGFYLSRTENYNYGGNTAGLRWTFWLIPFWLLAMVPVLDRCAGSKLFRGTAVVLLFVSVFSATWALDNPWTKPWLFQLMQRWKWIDYSTPPARSPYRRPIATWFPRLPETKAGDVREWVRFEGFDVRGHRITLELRDGGTETDENSGELLRIVEARWSRDGRETRKAVYYIDPAAFNAGHDPAEFLRYIAGGETQEEAFTFLRGLPARRRYSVGRVAYEFTLLREDALRVWKSASQVILAEDAGQRKIRYRCDAWLTDDVPFGVVQVWFRTFDRQTGEVISALQLTAVKASRVVPAEK